MDYIFLVIAAMLYSVMFLTNRRYQRNNGTGLGNALTFSMYTSAIALVANICTQFCKYLSRYLFH